MSDPKHLTPSGKSPEGRDVDLAQAYFQQFTQLEYETGPHVAGLANLLCQVRSEERERSARAADYARVQRELAERAGERT